MKPTDAALLILSQSNKEALSAREIIEEALKRKLISPKSRTTWTHLYAALKLEIKKIEKIPGQ